MLTVLPAAEQGEQGRRPKGTDLTKMKILLNQRRQTKKQGNKGARKAAIT